jgi:hypothetical protein
VRRSPRGLDPTRWHAPSATPVVYPSLVSNTVTGSATLDEVTRVLSPTYTSGIFFSRRRIGISDSGGTSKRPHFWPANDVTHPPLSATKRNCPALARAREKTLENLASSSAQGLDSWRPSFPNRRPGGLESASPLTIGTLPGRPDRVLRVELHHSLLDRASAIGVP